MAEEQAKETGLIVDLKELEGWDKLSEKQRVFILNYLREWSVKRSAQIAGVATITIYNKWLKNENFKNVWENAKHAFIGELEDRLFAWIDEKKDTKALLEVLKIRGRKFGWGESVDINHNGVVRVEFIDQTVKQQEDEDEGDNADC